MDKLLDLFKVNYSELGSNHRSKEETLMHHFSTFLEECEDGLLNVSCGDVLAFTTGSSTIPPVGFQSRPTIVFTFVEGLPTASTCSNVLRIPMHLEHYGDFKEAFDLALRGCQGFGTL